MAVIEKAVVGPPAGAPPADDEFAEGRPAPAPPIPPEKIHRALDKVVASAAFTRSPRLTKFLRYIVEQSLEGRGPELKEYLLAVEVFGRKTGFDPRIDPIVRVEAGRLRIRLKEYYRLEGKVDEVRIECAKGGYAVVFRTPVMRASKSEVRKPKRRECPAIAVLPFNDLSPEKDQEYFCDGITEELIGLLTQIEGICVASSMSAFAFKGKSEDIRTIGRKLNVTAIVEGSVRKDGDKLRITARLADVHDGFERWSETRQWATKDIFAIQNEISQSIVANVMIKLLGFDAQPLVERHTQDPEAYRMYLRGRHHWNQRTEAGLQTGIQYFKQAIAIDPGYALAFAGVADSYAILGTRGALPPNEAMPRSEKAALQAIALDYRSAEAHASFALVLAVYRWKWREAEQAFRAAIELNPEYVTARQWYAVNCLVPTGRIEDAVFQLERALETDPVSMILNSVLGLVLSFSRRYDEAIKQFRKAISLDCNFYMAHWYMGLAYCYSGIFDKAQESLETAVRLSGGIPRVTASLGVMHAFSGNKRKAIRILGDLKGLSSARYVDPAELAQICAALGDRDQALDLLDQAYELRAASLVHLLVNPAYDSLRDDTHFQQLSTNVGVRIAESAAIS